MEVARENAEKQGTKFNPDSLILVRPFPLNCFSDGKAELMKVK